MNFTGSSDIFVRTYLNDKIKVKPQFLCKNIKDYIHNVLVSKFEGKCTYHGYIKPNSIKIIKVSLGQVQAITLNGDIVYNVQYQADVCNPSIGSIIQAKVVNTNVFGILAECGIDIDNTYVPILEIIIAKNTVELSSDIDTSYIKTGHVLYVEILGKKYELNETKISIVGKVINSKNGKNILDKENINDVENDSDEQDVDDISDDSASNKDENEEQEDEEEQEDDEEENESDQESEGAFHDDEFFSDAENDDNLSESSFDDDE